MSQTTSHIIKETWLEWAWVPVELLNAYWKFFDEISQMCSLRKHNQVDTLVLCHSCQHTSLVNSVDTQAWVCNLPYAGYYQNFLQTRTLQLLKFIQSMPEKGWSVNRASPNHFRSWTQIKDSANWTQPPQTKNNNVGDGKVLFGSCY